MNGCAIIMNHPGSFNMDWLQNVLEIRPVFSSNEIYWSEAINNQLTEETESGLQDLSLLILDSLEEHFNGRWGDVGLETANNNDESLKKRYRGINNTGALISCYSNTKYTIMVITSNDYSETKIIFNSEYCNG